MKETKRAENMKSDSFERGVQTCLYQKFLAFTLAEMMVVLLILSIVLAAMAPVMTTRIKRDMAGGLNGANSIWQWSQNNNGVAAYFGAEANQTAMIGQTDLVEGDNPDPNARLIINASETRPYHILFKNGNDVLGKLFLNEKSLVLGSGSNTGNRNTIIGIDAFTSNTTGEGNVAIGYKALKASTVASHNVAIGDYAMYDSTGTNGTLNASDNVAIGLETLSKNTSGFENIAIGRMSLKYNQTGGGNIALGTHTMWFNNSGSNNIALGNSALSNIKEGNGNIALGYRALESLDKVSYSTGIGFRPSINYRDSIVIGTQTQVDITDTASIQKLTGATAIGQKSIAKANGAIAIGHPIRIFDDTSSSSTDYVTKASGKNSIALGSNAIVQQNGESDASNSIAIGTMANVDSVSNAIAIGVNTKVSGANGIALGSDEVSGASSIAVGVKSKSEGDRAIVIGAYLPYRTSNAYTWDGVDPSLASGTAAIAIGSAAKATGDGSVAIGGVTYTNWKSNVNDGHGGLASWDSYHRTNATADYSTAIGNRTNATADYSTALGYGAFASALRSTAIGYGASASALRSTAIGYNATANKEDQITLGNSNSTVYIPGRLIVGKESFLGLDITGNDVAVAGSFGNNGARGFIGDCAGSKCFDMAILDFDLGTDYDKVLNFISRTSSDRRLKYVGKEFTSGLDKIRQLKVFNYTFKKDEKKTPHVGVIAQDLQKIFPNAVKKGADGFLTIRMEDMFYALVNAVKELDAKVTAMAADFAKQKELLFSAQKDINTLKKENKELKAQNKKLEARLNALEAKLK